MDWPQATLSLEGRESPKAICAAPYTRWCYTSPSGTALAAASARRAAAAAARCCLMYSVWTKSGTLSLALLSRSLLRLRVSFLMTRVRLFFSVVSALRCSCSEAIFVLPVSSPCAAAVRRRMASVGSAGAASVPAAAAPAAPAARAAASSAWKSSVEPPAGALASASAMLRGSPWARVVVF